MGSTLLKYQSFPLHYLCEKEIYNERISEGRTVLSTKFMPGRGHFAALPLDGVLTETSVYLLKIRFMVKTQSPVLSFHLFHMANGQVRDVQVIDTFQCSDADMSDTSDMPWIEREISFIANAGNYNAFGIGALQLFGEGNYFIIDAVEISEESAENISRSDNLLVELIRQNNQMSKTIGDLLGLFQKDHAKTEFLLWNLFRHEKETLSDAKKRFFHSLECSDSSLEPV